MGGTLYNMCEWAGLCMTGRNGRDSVQHVRMGGTLYDRWEWAGLCMTGRNGRDSVQQV